MGKFRKASEPIEVSYIKGLFYGAPGLGKTTYSLTAPNPLLFDFDHGISRVQPRDRKDNIEIDTWADVENALANKIEGVNITEYDSFVLDTAGKLLDVLTLDIIRNAPPDSKLAWQGNLSQRGWGVLQQRFKLFLAKALELKKNLIFVCHSREDKDGDSVVIRPDVQGRSLSIMLKEMDLVGYMSKNGDDNMISFDPTERYYGKNTCLLEKNIVTRKFTVSDIINKYHQNQSMINEVAKKYNELISDLQNKIGVMQVPEDFRKVAEHLSTVEHIWDSRLQAGLLFKQRLNEVGYQYNAVKREYETKPETFVPPVPSV